MRRFSFRYFNRYFICCRFQFCIQAFERSGRIKNLANLLVLTNQDAAFRIGTGIPDMNQDSFKVWYVQ
jgi:hypothetical protein